MLVKMKARKCRKCKDEFAPKTEWQKFCSPRCRNQVKNQKKANLLRRAQRIIDAQAAH